MNESTQINAQDYAVIAYNDGFTTNDIIWVRTHDDLDPEVFFPAAHKLIEQGKTLKQIKLESDIPFVYDEDQNGNLIRGYEGTITEEAVAPVALQMVKGNPAKTIDNFLEIFRHDPHYDKIRFNVLKNQAESFGYDPEQNIQCWRQWTDADDASSRHFCESRYGIYQKDKHNDAMQMLWKERHCNPIAEMLDAFPAWDGISRCNQFFQKWLKASDSNYTRALGQLLFDAAVSRTYHAGCKFDYCIVLVGEEAGEGKSTIVRWLALDDDYAGEIADMNRDNDKILDDISGKWIVEVGEYLMKDSQRVQDATKAFITRTQDTRRTPYHQHSDTLKRRCIFLATTNHREFLTDNTGIRRWLPITVHSNGADLFANEQAVKDYIKLCYAEAVYRYKNGLCELDLPASLKADVKERQSRAVVEDPRVGIIEDYIRNVKGNYTCGIDVWINALNYPRENYTTKPRREISEILHKFPFLTDKGYMILPVYGKQIAYKIDATLFDEVEIADNWN